MSVSDGGTIRRSQVITTYGPGALLDLPRDSAIVAGTETWPPKGQLSELEEIVEPRLSRLLRGVHGIEWPQFYAPPSDSSSKRPSSEGIDAWRFPLWFVAQAKPGPEERSVGSRRKRRLVHRNMLEQGRRLRFEGDRVVPIRFVRACRKGHVDDLDWQEFVHRSKECPGTRPLWLDEDGTGGDLGEIIVRCDCKASRRMHEATAEGALGSCSGALPWLGPGKREACSEPSRLLVRTATNSYFPRLLRVLSLPEGKVGLAKTVDEHWDDFSIVDDAVSLEFVKRKPRITAALRAYGDDEVLRAIEEHKAGGKKKGSVKEAELEAVLDAPEGCGDEPPVDDDFHVRRLPDLHWRRSSDASGPVAVYQLHRLREVLALTGFTRFDALLSDIHGDFPGDVEVARLADEPRWYPAVENRGEGVFLEFSGDALQSWLARPEVKRREAALQAGYDHWRAQRNEVVPPFPGARYILLHTLSHLLISSFALRCGYPAGAIRERIYVEERGAGILLYTGSPDAEGTLGGLVHQGRNIEAHLRFARRMAEVCSNDPVCSEHDPKSTLEHRWLHGAACHGCTLISETSCEMRNDYLDRALVAPTLGNSGAAFFESPA